MIALVACLFMGLAGFFIWQWRTYRVRKYWEAERRRFWQGWVRVEFIDDDAEESCKRHWQEEGF